MDKSEEVDGFYSSDVVRQLLSTKTSTLALMTTSLVLFVTLVAKSISSKPTGVMPSEISSTHWLPYRLDGTVDDELTSTVKT